MPVRQLGARWLWGARAAAALGAASLALVTVGLSGLAILAGTWLIAAAVARTVPGLGGPVSWAAAILVELTLVIGLSAALAAVSPRTHGQLVNLAVLVMPALVGLALLVGARLGGRRWPSFRRPVTASGRPGIAWVLTTGGLAIASWVASRGTDYGIAWALGGDARNQVEIARTTLAAGGLTVTELKSYPAVINDLIAMLSAAGGRGGLGPGELLLRNAQALATTYILSGIAVAAMFVAALLELLPPAMAHARRLPPSVLVVLAVCAVTSASPLVLGTALVGGFVTAYGTLPIALAATVLSLRLCSEPSPAAFGLLGPAVMLALFSWSLLAVVPMALVVLTGAVAWRTRRTQSSAVASAAGPTWAWISSAVVAVGAGLVTVGIAVFRETELRVQFQSSGAITAPQLRILYLLGFAAAGAFLSAGERRRRLQLAVPLTVAVVGGATVKWLISIAPGGQAWTYYAVKSLWLVASCLIWVGFVPVLLFVAASGTALGQRRWTQLMRVLQSAAWSSVVLIILGFSATITDPVPAALIGWDQPSAAVVAETLSAAESGHPFVLWQWSDPGNERLGNFWAALAWDTTPDGASIPFPPSLTGGLAYWAYFETGAPAQLCAVARSVPQLVVITRSADLAAQLKASCPQSRARVRVT